MKPTTDPDKMLSIRIPYELGARLKAVCALRGLTVRDVMSAFAAAYVQHAKELPPADAPYSLRLAALAASVSRLEGIEEPKHPPKRKRAG